MVVFRSANSDGFEETSPFVLGHNKRLCITAKPLDKEYLAAAYELGTLYFNPTGTFKKDFQLANKYYLIAAENNNPDALYMLGYMRLYGSTGKRTFKNH